MTGTGQAMGTADYMAPEQTSDSRTVDIRANVYSLGATLYKLLSGRAPFSGPEYQGTFEKMQAHRQTPPPPIGQFCPGIPEGLVAVLHRMLAKDPAARYQTPAEAAEALAPFCAGSDLPNLLRRAEASNVSPLPLGEGQGEGRTLPKVQSAPRRWRTIAAVVVALLLVGGLGFWLGVTIHIRNQNGEEMTLNVPNGSDVDIDHQSKATVTPPGETTKERSPQNADLQRDVAKLTVELAAQRALLAYVDQSDVPPSELDLLVQNDPVAKQLSTELGWKKMDRAYVEQSTKNPTKNPYAKRQSDEVNRLQKQYDQRVKELEAKVRQNKRSVIQTEIVRLQAQLAALRQQQGGPQEAAPAAFDAKALQGTWEIVSSTFSMVSRLPGEENVSDERVRKSTNIAITADRFRVMGKYVFNRAFEYQLNPDAKPKIVDFQANGGMNIYLGIYQLSGNELKICATQRTADTSQRPTEFWAEYGGGKELLVLRRVGGVVVSEDEKKILGTWRVESQSVMGGGISLFSQGQKVVIEPREMKFIGWGTINRIGGFGVGGTSTTLVAPPAETQDSTVAEAYYALDSTSQPKSLDIDGSGGGGPINAIYELQGDRLTLCYGFGEGLGQGSIEGSPRPTKFAADEKTGTVLVVLKRVAEPTGKFGGQGAATSAEKPKEAALQFGPVIERVVNARSEGKGKDALDLANGKLVDLPKDFDKWPADKQSKWCAENNVDLFVTADPVPAGLNTVRPVGTPAWQLAPQGLKLAAVWSGPEMEGRDAAWNRWQNITERELRSALTSKTPGKATTLGGQLSVQVAELYEQGGTTYFDIVVGLPATFVFQTRKGELGMLQVMRYTKNPTGLGIRYKLAQPTAPIAVGGPAVDPFAANAAQARNANETPLTFGPVIERVVNARSEGKGNDAINLANGKLVDLPKDFCQQPAEKQRQWCEQNNADLLFDAGTKDENSSLVPEALMLALVDDEQWGGVPENVLRAALTFGHAPNSPLR